MFNVGGMELIVIGILALVVLGPDKLPGALRQVGTVVGELRRISKGFQVDLKSALDEAERDVERQQRDRDAAAAALSSPATPPPAPGADDARAVAEAELADLTGGTSAAPDGAEAPGAAAAGGTEDAA